MILPMPAPLTRKMTFSDLRAARRDGRKVAMLTCYDYTTARLMHEAGVPALLVGDSAANVILGHPTTVPIPLSFLIELAGAVRRGAPMSLLVADMPFGSYHQSVAQGVRNVTRMLQRSGCDGVKLEVAAGHDRVVRALEDMGVAVVAHFGLRPQSVGVLGGYRYQGRTADEAERIVALARHMERAGASALLLEAVPAEVGRAVVDATELPVIGCGAGPHCHGSVFVTHDALGLTPNPPRFVPDLGDAAGPMKQAFAEYVRRVTSGEYPGDGHGYPMEEAEKAEFLRRRQAPRDGAPTYSS